MSGASTYQPTPTGWTSKGITSISFVGRSCLGCMSAGEVLSPFDMSIIAYIDLGVNIQVAQKSDLCFDIGLGVKMEVKMYGQF